MDTIDLHEDPKVKTSTVTGTVTSIHDDSSEDNKSVEPPKAYTLKDLLIVFLLVFLPMMTVAFVAMAFIFFASTREVFPDYDSFTLPVIRNGSDQLAKDSFYTTIGPSRFSLISTWAGHCSLLSMPWFMILFSYLVARDFHGPNAEAIKGTKEIHELMQAILKGTWKETTTYFKITFTKKGSHKRSQLRALHVAATGLIVTIIFSVLLIAVGQYNFWSRMSHANLMVENWMHIVIKTESHRQFEKQPRPTNDSDVTQLGSFAPWSNCSGTIHSTVGDPFAPSNILPCSLSNSTSELLNVADSADVYSLLQSGITPLTAEFNQYVHILTEQLDSDQGSFIEIVSHFDNKTNRNHAFYYNPFTNVQYDGGNTKNGGYDYVANTISMTTDCAPITASCNFPKPNDNGSDLSIPFNCSSMFSGDLNIPPPDGLEQFKGWQSSFYSMSNGLPKNISVASQLNPFTFNVSVAANSASIDQLGGVDVTDHTIVDVGSQRVAFALSCSATIWDVKYSLINGSIYQFNATPSIPQIASIVKAPLQVGFGRHSLFEAANLAIVLQSTASQIDDWNLTRAMEASFSQIGVALSWGAFNYTLNDEVRWRFDMTVTRVPKAPLFFLICTCLLYAVIATAIAIAALCLRRVKLHSDAQVELLPRTDVEALTFIKESATTLGKGAVMGEMAYYKKEATAMAQVEEKTVLSGLRDR
jgi:hypothetical protein